MKNVNRVLVLDKNLKPLMPCHPAKARELLNKKRAAVYRITPFTIIIKDRTIEESTLQTIELKLDPGAKTTGMALVAWFGKKARLIFAAHIEHRAKAIVMGLKKRAMLRRGRRARKCKRYREKRFNNRTSSSIAKGMLPPSLRSILNNIQVWISRIISRAPIAGIVYEKAKFDTQKLQNIYIAGAQYQQGTLFGTTLWHYLLAKYNYTCVYCEAKDVPLTKDHVIAKSNGGSDRVDNLVVACKKCNVAKGNKSIHSFTAKAANILATLNKNINLRGTAHINVIRNKLKALIYSFNLPVMEAYGDETKFNREQLGYHKEHYIDAACCGWTGRYPFIAKNHQYLNIKAIGRGKHQVQHVNKYGFPVHKAKTQKEYFGFRNGDLALVQLYTYETVVKVTPRATGYFNLPRGFEKTTTSWRDFKLLQRADGYDYSFAH